MSLRTSLLPGVIAGLLLFAPTLAQAQMTLTLSAPNQSARPGSLLTFAGTLTNPTTTTLLLNGDSFTLNGPGLTLDDSPFFLDGPLSLGAGQVFTGSLFTVRIAPTAPLQSTPGVFRIIGGTTDTAQNVLAAANFSVAAVAAPEPGSGLLLLGGGLLGVVIKRRRRRG
ncbi:MAG: PEP-CTERM sorting domain-containing protein [Armatimonadota bacterium]